MSALQKYGTETEEFTKMMSSQYEKLRDSYKDAIVDFED